MINFLRKHWVILLLAIAGMVIHLLLVDPAWQLQRDEYLYLAQGDHLAWGYLAVPPTIGFLGFICKLLGGGVFIVRFFPALFGALTLFLTGKIVMELGGKLFAQFLACLAYLASGYLRLNLLFQPNSLEVLYFTLCAYFLIRYIHTSLSKYIIYTGIFVGLGMLNKYSILLFPIGAAVGMLLTPYRKLFGNKKLYIALAAAVIISLPNLLWQYFHHFPVVHHLETLAGYQLKYNSASGFLKEQIINCFPCLIVWIAGLIYYLFSRTGKPYRWIAWIYLTVIVILMALHGKGYYAMGAYPMLMAGGGVWIEQLCRKNIWKWSLRPALVTLIIVLFIPAVPLLVPVYGPQKMARYCAKFKAFGVLRWEDGKEYSLPQDYADMLGWKEMAAKAGAAYNSLDSAAKRQTIIFCDNYGEAGAVEYYGKQYHLPTVQGKEASFLQWTPANDHFVNLVVVTNDTDDIHKPLIKDNFSSVAEVGSITNPYAREQGTVILLCKGANQAINDFLNERNRKLKEQF